MLSPNLRLPNELQVASIPLINISRSPSPYQRRHLEPNPISDTEEEDDSGDSTRTPFLPQQQGKTRGSKNWYNGGGCGQFFFNTPLGWQIYVGILVLWLGGCQIGLILMNRIILWTGVYKFPYPLTTTYFEMLITHFWILLSAYITRWAKPWLNSAGLSGGIAPSRPLKNSSFPAIGGNSRSPEKYPRWAHNYHGGIAGGGLFEFEIEPAKVVLPSALIFVAKVCLSNLSFAYAQLQIYFLARIGIVPLSLIFTYILSQTPHSVATISSALTATLTLLVATSHNNVRVTWESIIAGVFSSLFVSLYPIQIHRSYKALVSQLVPQGELLGSFTSSNNRQNDFSGSKEESRAYWRLLHYTSLLSIIIFTPIVLLSGEVKNIWRNCYFLDVFFHWLMVLCGGLGSWAVFWATIALTRATNPLIVAFLSVPRAAFLLPIMSGQQMPPHSWVGIGMCWASCLWFLIAQKKNGKKLIN
ncbi:hypothetical protein K3495_g3961 [Podosphaera aphanis]|nr:hypothetical protein K3495_g3961 [Podosphaera aphanis]